jgi:hypothetical protein
MGSLAVLGAKFCASVFLYVRIFTSDGATVKSPVQPSGFVPGWDWGVLDCSLAIFFRVFSVKVSG